MGCTASPGRSPMPLAGFSAAVPHGSPPSRSRRGRASSACCMRTACRRQSAPTMAPRVPLPPAVASANARCGGSRSVAASTASYQDGRSTTGRTRACTAPYKRKPRDHRSAIRVPSRRASIASAATTTPSARTRHSTPRHRPRSTAPPRERCPRSCPPRLPQVTSWDAA